MNINERKKTTKILQEWKNFINEEKESKIKTIGDLKIALTKKESFKVLKETLIDFGIDLVPYGSTMKTLFGFFKSVSNIPDKKRKLAGPIGNLDLDDEFQKFIKEEVINGVLKEIIKDNDDSVLLKNIDLNNELISRIKTKYHTNISK